MHLLPQSTKRARLKRMLTLGLIQVQRFVEIRKKRTCTRATAYATVATCRSHVCIGILAFAAEHIAIAMCKWAAALEQNTSAIGCGVNNSNQLSVNNKKYCQIYFGRNIPFSELCLYIKTATEMDMSCHVFDINSRPSFFDISAIFISAVLFFFTTNNGY